MCQHVPLGPSEASTITELEQRKEDLSQQIEALSAKVVLRPEPSQFGVLQHEVAQFLGSLGSINRILALRAAIQVRKYLAPAEQCLRSTNSIVRSNFASQVLLCDLYRLC